MAVNADTHVNASVVMEKEIYEKLKAIAVKNKRSVSKQILYWVEERIAEESKWFTRLFFPADFPFFIAFLNPLRIFPGVIQQPSISGDKITRQNYNARLSLISLILKNE